MLALTGCQFKKAQFRGDFRESIELVYENGHLSIFDENGNSIEEITHLLTNNTTPITQTFRVSDCVVKNTALGNSFVAIYNSEDCTIGLSKKNQ